MHTSDKIDQIIFQMCTHERHKIDSMVHVVITVVDEDTIKPTDEENVIEAEVMEVMIDFPNITTAFREVIEWIQKFEQRQAELKVRERK